MGITNTSAVDDVVIDSIVDSVDGGAPFAAGGDCAGLLGTNLDPGATASCAFTLGVAGQPGDVVADTVTVAGTDGDGAAVSGEASETVDITDVGTTLLVTKQASVASVPEPGGPVTFTVGITNVSTVDTVSITSITDSVSGGTPFAAGGSCADLVGSELEPGASLTEQELLEFARRNLTGYAVPVAVRVVAALPRTPSLKVSRPAVLALFEDGGTPA